jgi:hypothetical protein
MLSKVWPSAEVFLAGRTKAKSAIIKGSLDAGFNFLVELFYCKNFWF